MSLAFEIAFTGESMQSRDGVHPYRAALFFILRDDRNQWSRKRRAAMLTGDIMRISQWDAVRLVAHSFGKRGHDVARDLIDTYRALEDGQAAP